MVSSAFPNRPFNLRENCWTIQQDINSNSSLIGWELWIDKTGYSPTYSGGRAIRDFRLDGTWRGPSNNPGFDFRGNGPWLIMSGQSWVGHNSDGTKTVDIHAYADYDTLGTTNVSSSMTIPTIPRTSRISAILPSVHDNRPDQESTIQWNRASDSFTHDVYYQFGNSGQVGIQGGAATEVKWTPPWSILQQIPNETTGVGTIYVYTMNGGNNIGMDNTLFRVNVPSSVVPTMTSVSVAETTTVPNVASIVGKYVQGVSRLKGTLNGAAGAWGSTVSSQKMVAGGQTTNLSGSPATGTQTDPISQAGSAVPVQFTVTDSRGRTTTQTQNVEVLAYSTPTINAFSVTRANSSGAADLNGTYLRVSLNASVSSLINSTQRNRLTIRAYTRIRGATTWTLRATPVNNSTTLTYNNSFAFNGPFDVATSYEVKIEVQDAITPTPVIQQLSVSVAKVVLHLHTSNGNPVMAVGKYWEQGTLDVGGDAYHRSGSLIDPAGQVTMFAGTTAPAGWLLCQGQAVSRTTYAGLFAIIGSTYGAGDGSTTFNLPDMQSRFPVGLQTNQPVFASLNKKGGDMIHRAAIGTVNGNIGTIGYLASDTAETNKSTNAYSMNIGNNISGTLNFNHHTPVMSKSDTDGTALPPYIVLNYIIKT